MATVSGTLKMFDSMSKPLQNITNAMNIMLNTMEKMQKVADKDSRFDKSIMAAKKQIATAETQIRSRIDQATKSQNKFTNSVQKSQNEANDLLSTLKSVAAAYLTVEGIKQTGAATYGAGMEQQSQIDTFAARTGNEAQALDIFDRITKQALKYGQDVNAALVGSQSFMSSTMDPKKLEELNMLAMRLAKLNPTEGLEGAVFSLKELASGDYTSISERFNISRSMLKDSEARAAGLNGDIDAFMVGMDKLLDQQNLTQEAFEKMLDSPAAKWNKVIQSLKFNLASIGRDTLHALTPLFDAINNGIDAGVYDAFFSALRTTLTVVAMMLSGIVNAFNNLFIVINRNGPMAAAILTTIATVILALIIKQLWATIPPLLIQAAAWMATYWPILLIGAAIGALVGLLMHFGVSAEQIVGAVVGFFFGLYTALMNIVALLWNLFASYAEFLINLFIDPVYAIKKLFYDLAVTFGDYLVNMLRSVEDFAGGFVKMILGAVNKALEGFNWFVKKANELFGTEFQTVGTIDTENVHVASEGLKSLMNQLVAPTSDMDVVSFGRMDQKNWNDSFQAGNALGAGGVGKLKNSLDGVQKALTGAGAYNMGEGGSMPNIDKVGEVGKIKKSVDISSEDLKVMRDLAEMKSIQNFVSLTPTVQVTTGDINQGADIDTIINGISRKLETEFVSTAQGVYT